VDAVDKRVDNTTDNALSPALSTVSTSSTKSTVSTTSRPPLAALVRRQWSYRDALREQQNFVAQLRRDPSAPEVLIFAEHLPVITLGRKANPAHLLTAPEILRARGVEICPTTRGGDITYHGAGQWTIYPILRLENFCRDLHRYLRMLEEVVIVYLRGHNLRGERQTINSGVWLGQNKIAAVGIACSNWISWHGIAINIQPDLLPFREWIVPCGIGAAGYGVTSLANETGLTYDMETERRKIGEAFEKVFPRKLTINHAELTMSVVVTKNKSDCRANGA
jgi:lipoate-protein ligase B